MNKWTDRQMKELYAKRKEQGYCVVHILVSDTSSKWNRMFSIVSAGQFTNERQYFQWSFVSGAPIFGLKHSCTQTYMHSEEWNHVLNADARQLHKAQSGAVPKFKATNLVHRPCFRLRDHFFGDSPYFEHRGDASFSIFLLSYTQFSCALVASYTLRQIAEWAFNYNDWIPSSACFTFAAAILSIYPALLLIWYA